MSAAPLGPQSFEHPYGGRGPLLMGVTWTMAAIAIILTALRTYTNAIIVKRFSWDYYWAILTLVTAIIGQSFQTVATASGLGNHFGLLNHRQQVAALKWSWLGHVPVLNGIGFGKLAVIAFLLRIQDRRHPKKRWFLYFVGFSGCVANFVSTVLVLLHCVPLEREWNDMVPGSCPHAFRTTQIGYFAGSWAAASDVLLALYPIVVYRNLQVSRKVKIAMFALLGGGVLAGASSAIKTVQLKLIDLTTDRTYRVFNLVLWELVECWLVLILGSLPPLRALFLHFFHHHHHHHQSSSLSFSTSRHTEQFSTNRGCSMYSQAKRSSPTDEEDNSQGSVDFVFRKTVGVGIVKTTDIRILREGGEERGDGGERGEVGGES